MKLIFLVFVCGFDYFVMADNEPVWNGKRYTLDHSENFDEILKNYGLSWYQLKIAKMIHPTSILTKVGDDEYVLRSETFIKDYDLRFKEGVEVEEQLPLGLSAKATFRFDGPNRLLATSNFRDVITEAVREYSENEMVQTIESKGVVAKRYFKAET